MRSRIVFSKPILIMVENIMFVKDIKQYFFNNFVEIEMKLLIKSGYLF